MPNLRQTIAAVASAAFILGASGSAFAQKAKTKPSAADGGTTETMRGIKSTTARKVILMPVTDKSGQGSALAEFATEVINQSVRNGGISTVAWFKVEKQMKKVMGGGNPYAYAGGGNLTSDSNMNELIEAGKKLGARYILRSVILKQSENSQAETKVTPTVGMFFGFGGPSVKTEVKNDAEVDVKVDIISTKDEDIIASKTFSGRSREVTKDRANRLDGITGMQVFGGGSSMDATKVAFYDTIDKLVDFLQDKTQ